MVRASVLSLLWAASASEELHCKQAVVGAGWAGVYSAWRLTVDSGLMEASDLCLFEAAAHAGGRTRTISSDRGLAVDVGAMRFSADMHLPADLIHGPLRLNSSCFEPSCSPDPTRQNATLRKVVDEAGANLGFGKPIAVMLEQLERAGARIVYNAQLVSLLRAGSGMRLGFAAGLQAKADAVLLNLPRNALLSMSPESVLEALRKPLDCADNSEQGKQKMAVKGYLSYPEAWWLTRLNLTEGRRELLPGNSSGPLVQARYHGASSAACARSGCPGVLEVVDDFELGCDSDYGRGLCWYLQFWQDRSDAFQRLSAGSSALSVLHAKLLEMHAADLEKAKVSWAQVPAPTELYLGLYLSDSPLQPVPRMLGDNGPADYKCLGGAEPQAFLDRLTKPLEDLDLLLANNDFTYTAAPHDGDWAYASLVTAERLMHQHKALPKPSWLDEHYYRHVVLRAEPQAVMV